MILKEQNGWKITLNFKGKIMNTELINSIETNKELIKKVLNIDTLEKSIQSLEDKKIIEKILTIIEIKELKEEINNIEKQLQLLEVESNISSIEDDLNSIPFFNIYKSLKKLYKNLNADVVFDLQEKFQIIDVEGLLVDGAFYFTNLWDYTLSLRNKNKLSDFEIMREILYLLFEHVKKVLNIEWQEVNIGDKFDKKQVLSEENIDIIANNIYKIKEIILKGIVEDGKIIRKSIVKVKETK